MIVGLEGLTGLKLLEAFDWAFQPSLDKVLILEAAANRGAIGRNTSTNGASDGPEFPG